MSALLATVVISVMSTSTTAPQTLAMVLANVSTRSMTIIVYVIRASMVITAPHTSMTVLFAVRLVKIIIAIIMHNASILVQVNIRAPAESVMKVMAIGAHQRMNVFPTHATTVASAQTVSCPPTATVMGQASQVALVPPILMIVTVRVRMVNVSTV